MRLPRQFAGLLLAAGMVAGVTAAATPARADTRWFTIKTTIGSTWLCLEGDPAPDFAYRVTTQPCVSGSPAQLWQFSDQGGGVFKLVNQAVGWCMEANRIGDGSPIPLWPCTSTESNLRWVWDGTGLGFGRLESRISGSTGHCLDVPMGQSLPGLWMQLYTCNGSQAQDFWSFTTMPPS